MQGSGRIGFMFDWTYILILIGVAICLLASARVKIAFNKYNQVRTLSGITGSQAARIILDKAGLNYIQIERVSGDLTDHYDPKSKVLRLSQSVYDSPSVAAVGVAAHECGHAVQDAENYGPLALRTTAVPVAQFSSWIYWPLIIVGWVSGWVGLADLGILVFSFVVLFQLITLPVEFNASSRALRVLGSGEDIFRSREEYEGARSVLNAAALTYVASLISTILQLARLILINRRRK
ncbi:MAG: zinc metallopeptidase [Lachnospiraceae bacterium]|nr:zinc metallopeptidase [Lachnospiraceae bacterium]MBR4753841.1 zinc metallopeptidase [Lachnospiraceae bacterium]MBR4807334.1 zinc metallopeptidase [Lachnospiraceae bacterium]